MLLKWITYPELRCMVKQFLLVLIIAMLTLLYGCERNSDWKFLSNFPSARLLSTNPINGDLALSDVGSSQIEYIHEGKSFTIQLPPHTSMYQMCLSNIILFVDLETEKLMTYDEVENTWKPYSTLDILGPVVSCSTTQDNSVFIWGNKWIADLSGHMLKVPFTERIRSVTSDHQGNVWLLTQEGEIYIWKEEEWVLFNKTPQPAFRIKIIDDAIWILAYDKVYKWPLNSKFPTEIASISEDIQILSEYRIINNVDQDNNGNIWIVSTRKLWVYRNHQLTPINLPQANTKIYNSIFNPSSGNLYISTDTGVYYLAVDDEPK